VLDVLTRIIFLPAHTHAHYCSVLTLRRFTDACVGPTWELDLLDVGHMQFLDRQNPLFAMFSASGPTPDTSVRAISKVGVSSSY
jgi:hypothetical protein